MENTPEQTLPVTTQSFDGGVTRDQAVVFIATAGNPKEVVNDKPEYSNQWTAKKPFKAVELKRPQNRAGSFNRSKPTELGGEVMSARSIYPERKSKIIPVTVSAPNRELKEVHVVGTLEPLVHAVTQTPEEIERRFKQSQAAKAANKAKAALHKDPNSNVLYLKEGKGSGVNKTKPPVRTGEAQLSQKPRTDHKAKGLKNTRTIPNAGGAHVEPNGKVTKIHARSNHTSKGPQSHAKGAQGSKVVMTEFLRGSTGQGKVQQPRHHKQVSSPVPATEGQLAKLAAKFSKQ